MSTHVTAFRWLGISELSFCRVHSYYEANIYIFPHYRLKVMQFFLLNSWHSTSLIPLIQKTSACWIRVFFFSLVTNEHHTRSGCNLMHCSTDILHKTTQKHDFPDPICWWNSFWNSGDLPCNSEFFFPRKLQKLSILIQAVLHWEIGLEGSCTSITVPR